MAEQQKQQQQPNTSKDQKKKNNRPKRNYDKKLVTFGDYLKNEPGFQDFYNQLKKQHGSKSRRN